MTQETFEIKPFVITGNGEKIITSDGFEIDLEKPSELNLLWLDDTGSVHTDIWVHNIRVLHLINSAPVLVEVMTNYVEGEKEVGSLKQIDPNVYIFKATDNMFKFGAIKGQHLWKDNLNKPWVLPPS